MIDVATYIMMGDLFITGVQFTEDQIQIGFLENRHQQVESAIMQTMIINLERQERWKQTYIALQETLKDLVNDVMVFQREEGKPQRTAEIKTPQERMAQAREEERIRANLGLDDE